MKIKHFPTICALSACLAGLGRAQDIKFTVPPVPAGQDQAQPPAPAPSQAPAQADAPATTPSAPAFTDVQKAEEFGWFVSQKVGITDLSFSPEQAEAVGRGVTEALEGRDSPYDVQKIGPEEEQYARAKTTAAFELKKRRNLAVDEAMFKKLKDEKNVIETQDGLRYEILQPGTGASPAPTDTIVVNYTGWFIDGTVFDSSKRHGKPVEIALNQTIPGWIEGLQKIGKGGKIRLYIPPDLAYGDNGNSGVPPEAALIFEVELLDVKPAGPAAAGK
jgi:FKBP-type peptidyl-prolyl cis-trans isomerase